jgi:copper chaperone CopZ
MSSYLHVIDGRLRIKVPEVKRAPHMATAVVQSLQKLEGVIYVRANPITGNVLVIFEPGIVSPEHIVQIMQQEGCFQSDPLATASSSSGRASRQLGEKLLQSVFETALQHVILALI